ncbi:phosphoribosyl-AMP cyclohydrolase [Rhizobium sp.]|jgi:phosphoribosyl-AMP cyclohydrolase|uniref:phosphoribosyl-AMP cyclohydrolase n=1 Tax=Rhizobium sp. TaxID=391 RepID=UPI000E7E3EF5|nr:phosphoribosyl-AMP cyclohydrolase [Rhizobium sp.]
MIEFTSPSADKSILEDKGLLTPKFDAHGLVTAVVTDHRDGELLMVAHMNAEALALTIETNLAHYYSRSRKALWKKGESSGNMQRVKEIRVDCDQDAIWLKVEVTGVDATCHTGRRSCFYRSVQLENGAAQMVITDDHRHFDPNEVYGKR